MNGAGNAEPSHKFAAAASNVFRVLVVGEPSPLPNAKGRLSRHRWSFHVITPPSQNLTNVRRTRCKITRKTVRLGPERIGILWTGRPYHVQFPRILTFSLFVFPQI